MRPREDVVRRTSRALGRSTYLQFNVRPAYQYEPALSMTFHDTVDRFMNDGSEDSMERIIGLARSYRLDDDKIAYLALQLSRSGEIVSLPNDVKAADIASSGGPSSLSTVLCPLFLRCLGFCVPKLGVPGRPAGGVDIMAQIPGYHVHLDNTEVTQVLERCGYAHFLAADRFAPRDCQLFAYRKQHGAVDIPELAIASVLSKKLAVSSTKVGLDVRVAPHGNFGSSWEEAKRNAVRFNRVAKRLGIDAVCCLSDARLPYQPYIGRGEALLALASILAGTAEASLMQHYRHCFAMAKAVFGADSTLPARHEVAQVFQANLEAQGGSLESFQRAVAGVRTSDRYKLVAPRSGFVTVNLRSLRATLVELQGEDRTPETPFPDSAGIVLAINSGAYVLRDELLATVRCSVKRWPQVQTALRSVFVTSASPGELAGYEEIVDA